MIRHKAFWTLDKLKGGIVKNHFKEIEFTLEKYGFSDATSMRKGYLKSILDHSVANTDFYSPFKSYSSIHDFPVIDKIILRSNFEGFQAKHGFRTPKYEIHTSGSTGTPFQVNQDLEKKARNTADTLYFGQKGGYFLGQPLYYIRKWDESNYKSKITKWTQNVIPVDVSKLNHESLEKTVDKISRESEYISLIGYSSGFRDLCDHIKKKKLKLNTKVSSIIAISEALGPKTKNDMEANFNTQVLSRYSNAENGIIAQQFPNAGNNFHINWASYFVEILEVDTDKPAAYGNLGRIVITDLFNYCMPMIRYDTGDLGVMEIDNNPFNNAPVLTKVEGRKMDVLFDTKGNRVTPFLAYELEQFQELKQFQVIQEGKTQYIVLLNTERPFEYEQKAKTKLQNYLGDDADIYFKYVNEIPRLSSGKRKLTLNKYLVDKKV